MTTVAKKVNLDQYDILNARLDQTAAVLLSLAHEDQHKMLSSQNTGMVLYAAEELLQQGKAAFKDLFVESEED